VEASWLDYGALGLLAVVLGAVGLFLRGYLSREQDRAEKRDVAARDERRDLNSQFTDLVARDIEAKKDLSAAMTGLCTEVGAGQGQVAATLKQVADRMDKNEQRAADRHEQVMAQGAEILSALQGLNGKKA
jgi:predicted phage tail protein